MSWAHPGSHTSAGESGAGFGRLGQAVSRLAGSRPPHRYRVIVRRCDEKTTQNHRTGVAGAISGGGGSSVWGPSMRGVRCVSPARTIVHEEAPHISTIHTVI